MKVTPKMMMWVFGLLTIGGLALFLALYQSSPGPLTTAHATAVPGNMIWSCKKCHSDDGMESGCLSCHAEIANQLHEKTGFHTYLRTQSSASCEQCHPEHHGADFPLVSDVSWQGTDTNAFKHPQVEFKLEGKHDELACKQCHTEKFHEPVVLADFPDQVRTDTMLGLNQECISCHVDVHKSGEKTRDCTQCHDQNAFKPAPFFDHNKYFVLDGPHATAACAACHQTDVAPELMEGERDLKFGPVKGKKCADCHESPHRFDKQLQGDCMRCHKGTDEKWVMGQRGVDVAFHDHFGFVLQGAHAKVECAKCHAPELETYTARFPDPAAPGYNRQADQCSSCHKDPHDGQFKEHYPSCAQCHTVDRFMPSTLGPADHPERYPLKNGHVAAACNQCHKIEAGSDVRRFKGTASSCKECHANPHGSQFDKELAQNDCTACHAPDFSTFKIKQYKHENMRAFFQGKGHAKAACIQCHAEPASDQEILQYRGTPTTCASCHTDIHRGQFLQLGQTQCERCHGSFDQWKADRFEHDRDSKFLLDKAHVKVECASCHLPVMQPDGQSVVQYRPLTTRCEDCHGFQKQ